MRVSFRSDDTRCIAFSRFALERKPPPQAGASPDPQTTTDVINKIDQLVEQNKALEKQNQQLVDEIQVLRRSLTKEAPGNPGATGTEITPSTVSPATAGHPPQSEQPQVAVDTSAPRAGAASVGDLHAKFRFQGSRYRSR